MKVKDLIKYLESHDPEMEIMYDEYNSYENIFSNSWAMDIFSASIELNSEGEGNYVNEGEEEFLNIPEDKISKILVINRLY